MIKYRRRTLSALAACMLLASLLAGCGGDQPSTGQQTTGTSSDTTDASNGRQEIEGTGTTQGTAIDLTKIDPCTLLTQEEVEAIMGPVDYKQIRGTGIVGE